jgi:transposase InsO family protein
MCKLFGVSRSCYYHWLATDKKEDVELHNLVKEIFYESYQTYGTRRIKKELEYKHGLVVSRRKIGKIMSYLKLNTRTKKRFRVLTTNSNHNYAIACNRVQQDFYASYPNQIYVGDITYIKTGEGWLYLAVVIDLYSRKIVGWSINSRMTTSLINNALFMAIKRRLPPKGLIYHSDRGSQYASDSHRLLLKEYGFIQSMSGKGNCYDNAVAESFFNALKTELIRKITCDTRAQVSQAVFEYIEIFYNKKRLHSSNNYMSPDDFEAKMLQKEMAI